MTSEQYEKAGMTAWGAFVIACWGYLAVRLVMWMVN
jgi:hypothetical protein